MPKTSESDRRCRKIIEILLNHPEGLKGDDIAKRLQVSSRTIRTDIRRLQELLDGYGIKISAVTNRGYKLHKSDVRDILVNVLPDMPSPHALLNKDERCIYLVGRFLEAALSNVSITQAQLVDEMYVALSTLKLYLNEVKDFLAEYFIRITQYRNEGLRLQGDENDLRTCIVNFQRDIKSPTLHALIFNNVSSQEINLIIERVMNKCSLQLTDIARENICIQLALAVKRSADGYLTICSSSMAQEIENSFEYRIAKEIVNLLLESTGNDIPYNEVFYIAKCLLTSKKLKPDDLDANGHDLLRLEADDKLEGRLSILIDEILTAIEKNYGINFADDDYLKEGLLLHLRIAIAQVNFRMGMRNDLLSSIKSEYPLAFQLGILAARIVRERVQIIFSENEVGYIALHFGAAMSRNHIKETDVAKKIIIVGSMGLGISIMLKTKIKEYFRNRLQILNVIPAYKLDAEIIAQADYIFTTVSLKDNGDDKVIKINNVLNEDDLRRLDKIIFQKSLVNAEIVKTIFDERYFFFDMEFETREQCLKFLTDKAIEHGLMDANTKDSVFEREKMSSTAIGDFAAIPHALITVDNISKVLVLTLKKAIVWGDLSVQAIFLLNIEHGKSQLWEEIFFKLYDYIKKHDGVISLLKHKSYKKFLTDFLSHFD